MEFYKVLKIKLSLYFIKHHARKNYSYKVIPVLSTEHHAMKAY
jgi:hypothetical protein